MSLGMRHALVVQHVPYICAHHTSMHTPHACTPHTQHLWHLGFSGSGMPYKVTILRVCGWSTRDLCASVHWRSQSVNHTVCKLVKYYVAWLCSMPPIKSLFAFQLLLAVVVERKLIDLGFSCLCRTSSEWYSHIVIVHSRMMSQWSHMIWNF